MSAPEEYFEEVTRTRVLLSLALLPPLLFFFFLVFWFREGFILVPVAVGLYLWMLAQFFVFQSPGRRARARRRLRGESGSVSPAETIDAGEKKDNGPSGPGRGSS